MQQDDWAGLDDWLDWNSDQGLDAGTLEEFARLEAEADPRRIALVRDFPTGARLTRICDHVFSLNDEGTYDHEGTVEDFIQDVRMHDSLDEYFGDKIQEFNDDFWASPVKLYHGTDDIEGVMAEGIKARSETRGLGNRSVGAAVFATTEPSIAESYSMGLDGGIVIIDTTAMKRDGYMPFVCEEPEVLEEELTSALASALGDDEYVAEYGDAGIDPSTIIIDGDVPAIYLTRVDP